MSTPSFRFKQFEVWHDKCAMKVGTDGVLLGAWCPMKEVRGLQSVVRSQKSEVRILDVGTGSGLIALMLAQRCSEAQIDAIDIDSDAVAQAQDNFARSPWAERLHAHHCALQEISNHKSEVSCKRYDLIVSNPPYFVDSLKNPDQHRQTARHTDTLSYADLLSCAAELLADDGTLALILPAESENTVLNLAQTAGLSPIRLTRVYSKPGKPLKRVLVAFKKGTGLNCETTDFFIESETSPRSEEYKELTKNFYL